MAGKLQSRLVRQLEAKGKSPGSAYAISTAALQRSGSLKPGTTKPTAKGISRGAMTPAQRAKDRASKASGAPTSAYKYNSTTNRATKK